MWDLVKTEFATKNILFIGYGLEDNNILDIIQKVSDAQGSNQNEMFLIAPGISPEKQKLIHNLFKTNKNLKDAPLSPDVINFLNYINGPEQMFEFYNPDVPDVFAKIPNTEIFYFFLPNTTQKTQESIQVSFPDNINGMDVYCIMSFFDLKGKRCNLDEKKIIIEDQQMRPSSFGEINKVGHGIINEDGTLSIIIDIDPGINLEAWMYANVMQQELFHYFQYQTGIMESVDDNHSPIEYQENLMGWMNNGTCGSFLGNQSEEFDEWLDSVVHDGSVDLDAFLDGVAQWYEGFIQNHSGEYAEDADLQYQDKIEGMNWEEVLEWYGYTINK